jgi:hypothetical protein
MRTYNIKGKVVSNYIILCKGSGHIIKGEMVKDYIYSFPLAWAHNKWENGEQLYSPLQ